MTKILSIETSCDETSFAVIEARGGLSHPRFSIQHHLISSQIAVHRPFGGVVPNLAKREHLKNLPFLYNKLRSKGFSISDIDYIAVTVGPGLEPALWTGVNFAKDLAASHKKPIIGVNHLEGHLFSFLLSSEDTLRIKSLFPAIALIVSGGHTLLLHMSSLKKWNIIGETLDDAVGEAYDKVARLLELPYPGGPELERLAKKGTPEKIIFPRPMIHQKNYSFSFSGLKTAVLYFLQKNPQKTTQLRADVAAAFQTSAIEVLTAKTKRAAIEYNAHSIILAGGVAGNQALRASLNKIAQENKIPFMVPQQKMNTDNAAMIGAAAYISLSGPQKKRITLRANGNLSL